MATAESVSSGYRGSERTRKKMSVTRIVNNIAALNANRNLNATGRGLQKSIERLSSGLRINRAGDDAAGLTVSSRLRAQFTGINRAVANAQDGINLISVAEGALEEVTVRLNRMRVLSIQAGNTGVNDIQARQALQDEVFQSIDEINRIANTTQFNTNYLLNGDFEVKSQLIAGQDQVGVQIDQSPVASTLSNGVSLLNIVRTRTGSEQVTAGESAGESQVISLGIQNQSDVAVSLGRWSTDVTIDAASAPSNTILSFAYFQGVSLYSGDTLSFEGTLSDGIVRFAGSISIGGGDIDTLVSEINASIQAAQNAYWGDSSSVPDSFKTTAAYVTAGANAGRIVLLNKAQSFSEASINITVTRTQGNGELVAQAMGVTRTTLGEASVLAGSGRIGNSVTAITGSTFETGAFEITIEDVVSAQQRTNESLIGFRDANGALLGAGASLGAAATAAVINGTFVNGVYTGGTTLFHNSTITLTGTEIDGTTFSAVYTLDTNITQQADTNFSDFRFGTLSGLIEELNYRTRSYTFYDYGAGATPLGTSTDGDITRFGQSQFTLTNSRTIRLIDDLGVTGSQSSFTLTYEQNKHLFDSSVGHVTIQDDAALQREGFAEAATFRVNGGTAVRGEAGDVVTLYGPESTIDGIPTPQVTLRVGSGLSVGSDVLKVREQEFVGRLNGGPSVTFRNGDQDVVFIDNSSGTQGLARYVSVDFDAVLDVTQATDGLPDAGTTVLISTVNKSMNFQIGAYSGQRFASAIGDLRADNLGFGRGSGRTIQDINVTSISGVNQALTIIDEALDQVNRTRSLLGAATNRLESTVSNLSVTSENLTASYSRLRDADIAHESSEYTKNQVLLQAGTSVLAQANFLQQSFLSLLG